MKNNNKKTNVTLTQISKEEMLEGNIYYITGH